MKSCPSCKSEFAGGEIFCPNDGARLVTPSQIGTAPSASEDGLVGSVLSERYRIIRQIGEGGMGLVYEAEHVAIEKRVALKVLRDDFSNRPEVVERFKQEAKSASKIGNDHIVDISDFGSTPSGASYFVMELLEGEDLADALQREGSISVERAVDILLQCCKALGAAHAKGIVHRDMKPENIFLTQRDGQPDFVKIVDFGIAKMSDIETPGAPGRKLTKTGMIFGTPEYMSPEQAAGKPLDHRVDIYALAVILFEMVTGRVPFVGDTFMGILTQHMFEDPPRLEEVNPHATVSDALAAFIYRGLAKEADERFASCDEMADVLRDAMDGYAPSAPVARASGTPRHIARRSTPTAEAPAAPARSRTGLVVGAIVVALAALAGAGTVWYVAHGSSTADADDGTTVAAPPEVEDPSQPIAEVPPADAGAPAVAQAEPVDAGPAMATVSVNTDPSGARAWVVGRGQVCDCTPCSFDTEVGRAITVRARSGRAEAESELTPSANTVVQLELRPVRRATGGRTGGRRSGRRGHGGSHRGGASGDLKVPDIFPSLTIARPAL